MKVNIGTTEDYERLFQINGLRYLIDTIWMDYYQRLRAVVIYDHDEYTSYMPKEVVAETLDEGVRFLTDGARYQIWKTDFLNHIAEADQFSRSLVAAPTVTPETLRKFFDDLNKLLYFYAWTEFFYTDKAYQESLKPGNELLVKNLQDLGQVKNSSREFLNSLFFGDNSCYSKVLGKIVATSGVVLADLEQYSLDDLIALLSGKHLDQNIIDDRKKAFVLIGRGETMEVIVGGEALKTIKEFTKPLNSAKQTSFKGVVANKGKAKGPVKVVVSSFETFNQLGQIFDAMKKGDILVAETTSPELMPACLKAGAILTDQGGLMSHAAIVSRELNIPCIVALHGISKSLKDGDVVEVDADNGVVKVILTT